MVKGGKKPVVTLRNTKTGEKQVLYALQPKQLTAFNLTPLAPGASKRTDDRYVKHIGYGGAAGGGKVVADGSHVLTPWGWKRGEDLRVGDTICHPDGHHQKIILVHPELSLPRWTVRFNDGSSLDVMEEHLWLAWRSGKRSKRNGRVGFGADRAEVVTTATLREWTRTAQEQKASGRRPEWPLMPVCGEQRFTQTRRHKGGVDPYLLGLLIGDGHIPSLTITTSDLSHIVDHLDVIGAEYSVREHPEKVPTVRLVGQTAVDVRHGLRRWGLHECLSPDKFVPDEIKWGSVGDRYAVLAGLMDTDGYASDRRMSFCSVSRQLADDVAHLVRSLGGWAKMRVRKPFYYDGEGEPVPGRDAYDVVIKHPHPARLFRLPRKRERAAGFPETPIYRRVVDVTIGAPIRGRCITVSAPDGLYIADDFIVTHNSYLARAIAVCAALVWPGATIIIFRRTKDEVKQNHVNKFREECPEELPDGKRLYSWNGQDLCATFFNGSRIYFGYLKHVDDRLKYQGNEYDVMIFEEATHYAWESVRWLTGNRLRGTRDYTMPFVLYPSNPGNLGHAWYRRLFIDRNYGPRLNESGDQYAFVQAMVEDNAELLRRDPTYLRELDTLPEPYRSWLRKGDWTAGLGLALTMLSRKLHFVQSFRPPEHWTLFGAFDWGYAHPFSFGVYAVDEDGRLYKLDTISGRFLLPHEIAERVKERLALLDIEVDDLEYITAGHDTFAEIKARGENTPTIAEKMAEYDFTQLRKANTARISGLNNLRDFLKWEKVGPNGQDDEPFLYFCDTEGNRQCFEQLESMPSDPDNPEDALKQDADMFGNGGDDHYDETRYAAASRPPRPRSPWLDQDVHAWDPAVLAKEADDSRKIGPTKASPPDAYHPEVGAI